MILDVTDPASVIELGATIVGGDQGGGVVRHIAVRDGYAYVGSSRPAMFSVVDVSDPSAPRVLSSQLGDANQPYKYVAVRDGMALAWSPDSGLDCFSVTDPQNPTPGGECPSMSGGPGPGIAITDSFIYYAVASTSDLLFGVFGPENTTVWLGIPELAGGNGGSENVAVGGDYVYVTTWTEHNKAPFLGSRIAVIDISDPANPAHVGTWGDGPEGDNLVLPWGKSQAGAAVSSGRLYVVDWGYSPPAPPDPGLLIFDIAADPTSPTLLGKYHYAPDGDVDQFVTGVTVVGSTAYLMTSPEGLVILDCSNPADCTRLGGWFSPTVTQKAALSGDILYVTDESYGLSILDVVDVASPALLSKSEFGPKAWGIAVRDNLAYLSGGLSGGQVLDVSEPQKPALVASFLPFPPGYHASAMELYGNVAHMGAWRINSPGIVLNYDISDVGGGVPLLELLAFGFNDQVWTVATAPDGIAHIANRSALSTASLADPEAPFIINMSVPAVSTSIRASDAALDGDLLYVASTAPTEYDAGLLILDVADPQNPVMVGFYGFGGSAEHQVMATSVTVVNQRAYVGAMTFYGLKLLVLDISNPASPMLLADIHSASTWITDVIVDGPVVHAVTSITQEGGAGVLTYLVYVPGDYDDDGDIDELDAVSFADCFTGPDIEPGDARCLIFDFDEDGDIDCDDWEAFKLAWNGEGDPLPFAPCDNTCPADFDGDGEVRAADLAQLLGNWGPCAGDCPWDLDGNGTVSASDLAILLGSWGPCE